MKNSNGLPPKQGLYDPQFEHDSCGVGFVVNMKGAKSHEIVTQALTILMNLDHRGACGFEVNSGDGAGILIQMPDKFLRKMCRKNKITLPKAGQYGVGMIFTSQDAAKREKARQIFERIVAEEGQVLLGWRDVPTCNATLGNTAKTSEPISRQAFIQRADKRLDDDAFERKLYIIRKRATKEIRATNIDPSWYTASLSSRTMIYKGMLMPAQVDRYYPDLLDPAMETALALVHSRFSTNTFPSWDRSHPYRYIAHNGEINTLRGNINWMRARQNLFESDLFGDDIKKIIPIINEDGSDSSMFDNSLELLVMAGRPLP